jgi:hypothetical protein
MNQKFRAIPRLDQRRERNTATHPAFTFELIRGETVYSSGQGVYRGRWESSAQLGEWGVTIHVQLVAKPVQGFAGFQPDSVAVNSRVDCARRQLLPEGQCRILEVG